MLAPLRSPSHHPDHFQADDVGASCRLRFFAFASILASIMRIGSPFLCVPTLSASSASDSAVLLRNGKSDFLFVPIFRIGTGRLRCRCWPSRSRSQSGNNKNRPVPASTQYRPIWRRGKANRVLSSVFATEQGAASGGSPPRRQRKWEVASVASDA